MLVRLVFNSRPQVIRLPRPPKVLGLQARAITPTQYILKVSHFLKKLVCVFYVLIHFSIVPKIILVIKFDTTEKQIREFLGIKKGFIANGQEGIVRVILQLFCILIMV